MESGAVRLMMTTEDEHLIAIMLVHLLRIHQILLTTVVVLFNIQGYAAIKVILNDFIFVFRSCINAC